MNDDLPLSSTASPGSHVLPKPMPLSGVSPEDDITVLGLTARSHYTLRGAGINTIQKLLDCVQSGGLRGIRGISRDSADAIWKDLRGRVDFMALEASLVQAASGKLDVDRRQRSEESTGQPARVTPSERNPGELSITVLGATPSFLDGSSALIPFSDPDISELDLPVRQYNALQRFGIRTVRQLADLIRRDRLNEIRNIGPKSIEEIIEALDRYGWPDEETVATSEPASETEALRKLVEQLRSEVDRQRPFIQHMLNWQSQLIKKQVTLGLLHPDAEVNGRKISEWLESTQEMDCRILFSAFSTCLGTSASICDELETSLSGMSERNIKVLTERYGPRERTYDEIGQILGLTRERIRQLCGKLEKQFFNTARIDPKPLVRVQSALLIARDMGLELTYTRWDESLIFSGLLGRFTRPAFVSLDPIELMLATYKVAQEAGGLTLSMPDNLAYAIQAMRTGSPTLPARIMYLHDNLDPQLRKLIWRNAKFCGAVSAPWLARETREAPETIADALEALGFSHLSGDWLFLPDEEGSNHPAHAHDVFHNSIRKMLHHCGPLTAELVCGGLRTAVSRTPYPVARPNIIERVLDAYGYQRQHNKFCYEQPYEFHLNKGESVILDAIHDGKPVISASEIVEEFIYARLSHAAVHGTLKQSELFENIDTGLYKVRGSAVTWNDIQRAKEASVATPLDLEVSYPGSGRVEVVLTLSSTAFAIGTIISAQLPIRGGTWECQTEDQGAIGVTMEAEPGEWHGLRSAFQSLGFLRGDRARLVFNTRESIVTLSKVNHDGEE